MGPCNEHPFTLCSRESCAVGAEALYWPRGSVPGKCTLFIVPLRLGYSCSCVDRSVADLPCLGVVWRYRSSSFHVLGTCRRDIFTLENLPRDVDVCGPDECREWQKKGERRLAQQHQTGNVEEIRRWSTAKRFFRGGTARVQAVSRKDSDGRGEVMYYFVFYMTCVSPLMCPPSEYLVHDTNYMRHPTDQTDSWLLDLIVKSRSAGL